MAVQHLLFAEPFGAGGLHILFANFIHEGVLGQHGQCGKTPGNNGQRRQGDVPQVVGDLTKQAQLIGVVRRQATQGEPLEVGAAGEQYDKQNTEQEAGDRKADNNGRTAPYVEA